MLAFIIAASLLLSSAQAFVFNAAPREVHQCGSLPKNTPGLTAYLENQDSVLIFGLKKEGSSESAIYRGNLSTQTYEEVAHFPGIYRRGIVVKESSKGQLYIGGTVFPGKTNPGLSDESQAIFRFNSESNSLELVKEDPLIETRKHPSAVAGDFLYVFQQEDYKTIPDDRDTSKLEIIRINLKSLNVELVATINRPKFDTWNSAVYNGESIYVFKLHGVARFNPSTYEFTVLTPFFGNIEPKAAISSNGIVYLIGHISDPYPAFGGGGYFYSVTLVQYDTKTEKVISYEKLSKKILGDSVVYVESKNQLIVYGAGNFEADDPVYCINL